MKDHRPRFRVTGRVKTGDGLGVICATEIGVNVVRCVCDASEATAPVSWYAISPKDLLKAEHLSGQLMPDWAAEVAV